MTLFRLVIAAAVFLCLSACSVATGGDARGQAATEAPSNAGPTQSAPQSDGAPDPSAQSQQPLELAGKDPCTVIPVDVLGSLGSSPAKLGNDQLSATRIACSFRDINGIYGQALFFDTGEGFEKYERSSPGNIVIPTEVEGRDAYAVKDQQLGGCTVSVDAGPSRSVTVSRTGRQGEPVEPLCDRATAFAAAAIDALTSN